MRSPRPCILANASSTASTLEAFRQRHLVTAVAVLGEMPRGVRVGVHPHQFSGHAPRPDAGRDPERHGAGRDLCSGGDDGSGPDKGSGAADDTFEDHGARADQDRVLNDATLQMDQVTDHAIVTDPGLPHGLGVDDGAVLNGSPGADDDRARCRPG